MTIAQRVVTLQMCAGVVQGDFAKKFMSETADVMEAMAAQYNNLVNAAKDTVVRSNGEDPAITILINELHAQGHKLKDGQ